MNNEKNKINKKTNTIIIVILIGICLFHIINNYLWVKQDVLSWYPEKYYQLIYKNSVFFSLENIMHSSQSLLEKFISFFRLIKIDQGWRWGGVFYLYTASFNLIFGNNTDISLLANLPFFILLIVFTFLIGKEIAGNKSGVLAAFLVSFYPGIYGMSRSYGLDFPLVAMVTVSSYILIAKDITKIKYFLLFGLILGLTLLIKGPGAYFLIGPLAWLFYQHLYKAVKNKDQSVNFVRRIFWIFFVYGSFLVLAVVIFNFMWQFPQPKDLFNFIYIRILYPLFNLRRHFYWACPYDRLDIRSILFYASEMLHSMSKILSVLFCIGFLRFFKSKLKYKKIIYLWALVPYIIFTLNINKWGRYYFPVLPALALVTAIGIFGIKSRKCKIILVTLVTLLSLAQYYDLSFGSGVLPEGLYKHPDTSFVAYAPKKSGEEEAITRFLRIINNEKKDQNYKSEILFVAPRGIIDLGKFEYVFQTKNENVEFVKFFYGASNYKNCDYILILNYKPAYPGKPDLGFLKNSEDYRAFLKVSYPRVYLSATMFAEMFNVFTKFQVVDCYFSGDLIFYLCKNLNK